jgi:hypothetical protein
MLLPALSPRFDGAEGWLRQAARREHGDNELLAPFQVKLEVLKALQAAQSSSLAD